MGLTPEKTRVFFEDSLQYHIDVMTFPKPLLAAVNGPALAGGLDLALMLYRFFDRGESFSQRIFHDVSGHHELEQIIGTARFRAHAGHLESAKGMPFHYGPRAAAVDIEIPNSKLAPGPGDIFRAPGENRPG